MTRHCGSEVLEGGWTSGWLGLNARAVAEMKSEGVV
jgi:hypothetical protein